MVTFCKKMTFSWIMKYTLVDNQVQLQISNNWFSLFLLHSMVKEFYLYVDLDVMCLFIVLGSEIKKNFK